MMYFDADGYTWAQARTLCESLPGDTVLAKIDDADEFALAQPLFVGTPYDEVWFGANDFTTARVWMWTDGTPVTYFSWKTGEPNNTNDNCLVFDLDRSGNYDDRTCSDRTSYLCSRY